MRKNKLKQMFKEGKPIINGWLQIPSAFSAESWVMLLLRSKLFAGRRVRLKPETLRLRHITTCLRIAAATEI